MSTASEPELEVELLYKHKSQSIIRKRTCPAEHQEFYLFSKSPLLDLSTDPEPEEIQIRIRRPLNFKDELRLELTLNRGKCYGTTMRTGQLEKVVTLTEEPGAEEESEDDSDDGELRQLSLPSKTVDGKIVLEVYRGLMRASAPVEADMAFYNGELPSFGDLLSAEPSIAEPIRPWRTYTFHLSSAPSPQSPVLCNDPPLSHTTQHPRPFGYRQPPRSTRTPVPRPYHSSPILPSARLPQHAIFTQSPSPAISLHAVELVPDLPLTVVEVADLTGASGGDEPQTVADFFDFDKYDKDSNSSAELSPRYPPGSGGPALDSADAGPNDPPSLRLSLRVDSQPGSLPEVDAPRSCPTAPSSPAPAVPPTSPPSPEPGQQTQAALNDAAEPPQAGPIPSIQIPEPVPNDDGDLQDFDQVIADMSTAEIQAVLDSIKEVEAEQQVLVDGDQSVPDELPPAVKPLAEEHQPPLQAQDPDIPDDLLDLINSVDVREQSDIVFDAPDEGNPQQNRPISDKSDPAAVEDVLDAIEPYISPPASPILDPSSPTPPPPPPSQRRRPKPRAPALTPLSRIPVPFFPSSSPPPGPRPVYRPQKTRRLVQPGNPPPSARASSSRPVSGRTHDARYDDDALQYRISRRERSGSGVGRERAGPPNTEGRESRSSYIDRVTSKPDGRESKRRRLPTPTPRPSSPPPSTRAGPSKPRADPPPVPEVIYISSGSSSPPVPTPAPISSVSDKKRKRPPAFTPVWQKAMFDPDEEMLRQIRREKKRREREAAGPPTSVRGSSREKRGREDEGEGHGHRRKKEKKYSALNMSWGVPPPPVRNGKKSRGEGGESSKPEGSKKTAKGTGWAADDVIDFTQDSD